MTGNSGVPVKSNKGIFQVTFLDFLKIDLSACRNE